MYRKFGLAAVATNTLDSVARSLVEVSVLRLMHRDLWEFPPIKPQSSDFRFDLLTAEQVLTLASHPELELSACMAGRLNAATQQRNFCFAAKIQTEVVAYYWLAVEAIEAEHNRSGPPNLGIAMSFPNDYVFGYKAFVHPQYRGRGLYTALVNAACFWACGTLGTRHLISTVDWTNHAAQRSCRRQQLQPVGNLIRFGWNNRYVTIAPKAAEHHAIRFPQTLGSRQPCPAAKSRNASNQVYHPRMKLQRPKRLVDLRS